MNVEESLIAKKYALAFLNVYFQELSAEYSKKLTALKKFVKQNKIFYATLILPALPLTTKQNLLKKILNALGLGNPTFILIFVLLNHGRIELLEKVLTQILFNYKKGLNVQHFTINSSHNLTASEKQKLIKFTNNLSPTKTEINFELAPQLISGIKIKSETLLWERSIAKQLRNIKKSILRQEE